MRVVTQRRFVEDKLTGAKYMHDFEQNDIFTQGLAEEPVRREEPIQYPGRKWEFENQNHDLKDVGIIRNSAKQPFIEMPDFYQDFENNFDENIAKAASEKERSIANKNKPRMETCNKCGSSIASLEICNCQKIARDKELHSNKMPFEIITLLVLASAITLLFMIK